MGRLRYNIIDGGYMTYVYGQSNWARQAWPPQEAREAIIMMESQESVRKDRDSTYKSHRDERREQYVRQAKAHINVRSFREAIKEDPRVRTLSIPGLEADDLVVLGSWLYKEKHGKRAVVMGIDKDLLQGSRYLRLYTHKGERRAIVDFQKSLPKAIKTHPLTPEHIPMILSLLGDKSDSIPRILGKGNQRQGLWLLWELLFKHPYIDWRRAFREFGDPFLHNVWMTILPNPSCFRNGDQLQRILEDGEWNSGLLPFLHKDYRKKLERWI